MMEHECAPWLVRSMSCFITTCYKISWFCDHNWPAPLRYFNSVKNFGISAYHKKLPLLMSTRTPIKFSVWFNPEDTIPPLEVFFARNINHQSNSRTERCNFRCGIFTFLKGATLQLITTITKSWKFSWVQAHRMDTTQIVSLETSANMWSS